MFDPGRLAREQLADAYECVRPIVRRALRDTGTAPAARAQHKAGA